eukprot:COSAG04_NODE_16469_length_498_cov_0.779449_1_plen_111_part_01
MLSNPLSPDEPRPEVKTAHHTSSSLTRGEKAMAFSLIAPTLINWLVLAWARFIGTTDIVDSEDVSHAVVSSRSYNFQETFFVAAATGISSIFAHVWLTLGFIARSHRLAQV